MTESIVATVHGKVRGAVVDGIHVFKGVRYGAPTGGQRRFRPPAAPEPWVGVEDALAFAPAAPQLSFEQSARAFAGSRDELVDDLREQMRIWGIPAGIDDRQSEDCLFLNLWTPGVDGRRPVLVWLHGGGFVEGSGAFPWYDGKRLAARGDVVIVSMNHRLGVMGFLNLAEHGGEYQHSGRVGLLDLVAGLEWVRDNIEAFGGDPSNVTIFGESGGGEKVAGLLAEPSAEGLFHKAIMQSCLGGRAFLSQDESLRVAEETVRELSDRDARAIERVPLERLIAAQGSCVARATELAAQIPVTSVQSQFMGGLAFAPTRVDAMEDDAVSGIAAAAGSAGVPLMVGTTADETALLPPELSRPIVENGINDDRTLHEALWPVLGRQSAEIVAGYRSARPTAAPEGLFTAITTDHGFRIPSIRIAERRDRAGGAPVYMYLLRWGTRSFGGNRPIAVHAIDCPLVFDNVASAPFCADGVEPQALASLMSDAWIAFARGGDPSHRDLGEWPPYSRERRATMIFDAACGVENDPNRTERLAWESLGAEQLGLSGGLPPTQDSSR